MTGPWPVAKPIIRVCGLHKFFDAAHVVKGVDLEIMPGEVVVIIGPSGGGKSTFLRCLNLLEAPSAGTIEIDGVGIEAGEPARQRRKHIHEIRQKVVMVFQDYRLFPHMTVLDNLTVGPVSVKRMPRRQAMVRAEELLSWTDLSARQDDYPAHLSVGQQKQLEIGRALSVDPKILLFDDPTSGLDPEFTGEVIDAMERLAGEGRTMVVVSHELRFARNVADLVLLMDGGVWVEMGPPEELFTQPREDRTRRFLARIRR
jgi:cystine transport system ATP-binding protein